MHFVDTNILVYCYDDSDAVKRDRAQLVMRRLWEMRNGRLSHQVLQESCDDGVCRPAKQTELAGLPGIISGAVSMRG